MIEGKGRCLILFHLGTIMHSAYYFVIVIFLWNLVCNIVEVKREQDIVEYGIISKHSQNNLRMTN